MFARAGGTLDHRADARGVFIFRFEPREALPWPRQPVEVTPEGKVPVIYRLNLDDPASFLVSQSFPINNKDVLYISNASLALAHPFNGHQRNRLQRRVVQCPSISFHALS